MAEPVGPVGPIVLIPPTDPYIEFISTKASTAEGAEAVIVWNQNRGGYVSFSYSIINADTDVVIASGISSTISSNPGAKFDYMPGIVTDPDPTLNVGGFINNTVVFMMYRVKNNPSFLPGRTYNIRIRAISMANGAVNNSNVFRISLPGYVDPTVQPTYPLPVDIYNIGGILPNNLISPNSLEAVFIWSQSFGNGSAPSSVISYNILNASTNALIATVSPIMDQPFSVANWKINSYTYEESTGTYTNVAGFIDNATNTLWMLYRLRNNVAFSYGNTYSIKIQTISRPAASIFSNTVTVTMPNSSQPQLFDSMYPFLHNVGGVLPSNLISPSPTGLEAVFIWSEPLPTETSYSNIASYSLINATKSEVVEADITPIVSSSFDVNAWKTNPFTTDTTTNKLGTIIGNKHWMMYRVKKDNTIDNPSFNGGSTYNIQVQTMYKDSTPFGLSNSVSVTLPLQEISPVTLYGLTDVTAIQIDSTLTDISPAIFAGQNIHNPVTISNTAAVRTGAELLGGRIVNIYAPNPVVPIFSYYFTNELAIPFIKKYMLNNMLREPGRLVNGTYVLYGDNPDTPLINASRFYWRKANGSAPYTLPPSPDNVNNIPGSILYITQDIPDNEPTMPSLDLTYDNYAYITADRIGAGSLPTIAPLITAGVVAAGQGQYATLPLCLKRFYNDEVASPALVKAAPGVYLTEDGTQVGLLSPYNFELDGSMRLLLTPPFTQIKPNVLNKIPLVSLTLPSTPLTHEGMYAPRVYYRGPGPFASYSNINVPGGGNDLGPNPGDDPTLATFNLPPCTINYYKGCYGFNGERIALKSVENLVLSEALPILEVVDVGFNCMASASFANTLPGGQLFSYGGITYTNSHNALPQISSIDSPVINLFASFVFSQSMFENNTTITNVGLFAYNGVSTFASAPANLFAGCTNLVTIDNNFNFVNIGANAFSGCSSFVGKSNNVLNLTSPQDMTIGAGAFSDCVSLSSVTINAGRNFSIAAGAFSGCTSLTSVTINASGDASLASDILSGCTGIQHLTLHVKGLSFTDSGTINSLIAPFSATLTTLNVTMTDMSGSLVFIIEALPAITALTLNVANLTLNKSAGALFDGLTTLTTLNISTVKTIVGLTGDITLFNNCPNIGSANIVSTFATNYTFSSDSYSKLTSVSINVPNLSINSGSCSDSSMNSLILYNVNKFGNAVGSIDIDSGLAGSWDSLRTISLESANPIIFTSRLTNFNQLRSVSINTPSATIPVGNFLVGASGVSLITSLAIHCLILSNISDILSSLTNLTSLTVRHIAVSGLSAVALVPVSLDSINLQFEPDVVSIDNNIHTMLSNFVGVNLALSFNPADPTTKYYIHLEDVLKIRGLTITGNVNFINITDPTYLSTITPPPPRILGGPVYTAAELNMLNLLLVGATMTINGNVDISDNAFENVMTVRHIVINGASTIGNRAFYNTQWLTTVRLLGDSDIGDEAFVGTRLQTVALSGFTRIGDYAFKNVSTLKEVTTTDIIVSIDEGAFFGCTQLKSVSLNEGLVCILDYAFVNSGISGEIVIPSSTIMYDHVFVGCENITKLTYKCELLNFRDPTQLHDNFLDSIIDSEEGTVTLDVVGSATITPLTEDGVCDVSYKLGTSTINTINENMYYDYVSSALYTQRIDILKEMKNKLSIIHEAFQSSISKGKIAVLNLNKYNAQGQNASSTTRPFLTQSMENMQNALPVMKGIMAVCNQWLSDSYTKANIELNANDITVLRIYTTDASCGAIVNATAVTDRYLWYFNTYEGGGQPELIPYTYMDEFGGYLPSYTVRQWFTPGIAGNGTYEQHKHDAIPKYSGMARAIEYSIGYYESAGLLKNGFYENNIAYFSDVRGNLMKITDTAKLLFGLYNQLVIINNNMSNIANLSQSQKRRVPKPYIITANNLSLYVSSNNLRINELGISMNDHTDASGFMIRESSSYVEISGNVPYLTYRGEEITVLLSDASNNKITEISVTGILRRNITHYVSYNTGCVLEWMYKYALFNTIKFGIDYTFEGVATHIESMDGLIGSHIVITSPVTIISEGAMTDYANCIVDISSSSLRLEKNCFNRIQDSSMNIMTDISFATIGQELFDGGENCYISSNIPLINSMATSSGTTTNRSLGRTVAGVGDISIQKIDDLTLPELVPYLANLYGVSMEEITELKMVNMINTSTDSISSKDNPLYYISCVIYSTLQEKIVIAEPRDWFWCFPINQDVIFEGGHTTAHYNQDYIGMTEPAMLVGPHTYRVVPETFNGRDVGFKNNFAPGYFFVNGIKFVRDFARTAVLTKHNKRNDRDEPGGDIELYMFASQRKDAKLEVGFKFAMLLFDIISTISSLWGIGVYLKGVIMSGKLLAACRGAATFLRLSSLSAKTGNIGRASLTVVKGTTNVTSGSTKLVATVGTRTASFESGKATSLLSRTSNIRALSSNADEFTGVITENVRASIAKRMASIKRQSLAEKSLQVNNSSVRNVRVSMTKEIKAPMQVRRGEVTRVNQSTREIMTTLTTGENTQAVNVADNVALEITTGGEDIAVDYAIQKMKTVINKQQVTGRTTLPITGINTKISKQGLVTTTKLGVKQQITKIKLSEKAKKGILDIRVTELREEAVSRVEQKIANTRKVLNEITSQDSLTKIFNKKTKPPSNYYVDQAGIPVKTPEAVAYERELNSFIGEINNSFDDIIAKTDYNTGNNYRMYNEMLENLTYKSGSLENYTAQLNKTLTKVANSKDTIVKKFMKQLNSDENIDWFTKPLQTFASPVSATTSPMPKLSTKILIGVAVDVSIVAVNHIILSNIKFKGDNPTGEIYNNLFSDVSLPPAKLSEIADKFRIENSFALSLEDDFGTTGASGETVTTGPSGELILKGPSGEILDTLYNENTMRYMICNPYEIIAHTQNVNIPTYNPTDSVYNTYNESYSPLELSFYTPSTTRYALDITDLNDEGYLPATEEKPSPLFIKNNGQFQWAEIHMKEAGSMLYPDLAAFATFPNLVTTGDKTFPVIKFDDAVNSLYLATRPVSYRIETTSTNTRDVSITNDLTSNKVFGGASGFTIDMTNRTSIDPNEFCNGPSGVESFSINKVIIPSTVTDIGENAFYDAGLTSVEFTQSERGTRDVTPVTIGSGAFSGNPNLMSITFPTNLGSIGAGALAGCDSLTEVTFTGPPPEDIDQSVLDVLNDIDAVNVPPEYTEDFSELLDNSNINPVLAGAIHVYNLSFVQSLQNNTAPPADIYASWLADGIITGDTNFNTGSLTETVLDTDETPLYAFTRVQALDGASITGLDATAADGAQYKTGWICTYSANGIIPNF